MSKSLVPFFLVFFFVFSFDGIAQKKSVYNGISLKGSTGISTLHGDITINPFGKLSDGKFGFGVSGIKMFSPFFGIQIRYSTNNLSVARPDLAEQYTGQVSEIGMSARIEPIAPIGPNGLRRLYPYGRLGISNASYRAIRWDTNSQQIIPPSFGYKLEDLSNGPRENALSFPIAIGVGIRLNNKLSLEFEHSNSILNTDYLDATKGTGDWNDMFGFTNIGLRYSLDPSYRTGVPKPKNLKPELVDNSAQSKTFTEDNTDEQEETGDIDPFKDETPFSKVYVESIIPLHPISGDLFEVILRVHKENYTGPATLIQDFPSGFTAIKAPLRHANLDFVDQQAKITWSQMPIDSIVTLRYHVHIDQRVSGPHSIRGRIWYEQEDGNKSFQFLNQFLVTNRDELNMDKRFMTILADQKSTPSPYSTSVVLPSDNQTKQSGGQIDDLINNYIQTGQIGTSSMSNAVVNSNQSSIDRQIVEESDLDEKIQNLIGTIPTSSKPITRNILAKPETTTTFTEADLDRQIENLINGESGSTNSVTGSYTNQFIAKPGVEFRVQCGAFKSRNEGKALVRKYNIKDPLQEETHKGLIKYTVGSFKTYREAEAFRDTFSRRTNLYSVFIVAYRNGVRQANIKGLK